MKIKSTILILILVTFSCKKEINSTNQNQVLKKVKKDGELYPYKLSTNAIFEFRRNYSYSNETYENEKLKNELDNRNPERLFEPKNTKYENGMTKLGFFDKEKNLNLKNWEKETETQNKSLKLNYKNQIYYLETEYNEKDGYLIIIRDKNQKIQLKKAMNNEMMPPDYTLLIKDLDNDKNDEIIECHHWYIVNGDNYDFSIYNLQKK